MTILENMKELKVVPHKKKRGDVVVSSIPNIQPFSCKEIERIHFDLPNLPNLRKCVIQSTKAINMRSAPMNPNTQTSPTMGSREFVLLDPSTAFGKGNSNISGLFTSRDPGLRFNERHAFTILKPRRTSNGSSFSLFSTENNTLFIPVPPERRINCENLSLPTMTTPPRPPGRIVPPLDGVTKTPDSASGLEERGTAAGMRTVRGVCAGANYTTFTPLAPSIRSATAATVIVTYGNSPNSIPVPPSLETAATLRTPVIIRLSNVRTFQGEDAARYSLPRHLSLRPRALSIRSRISVTRGVSRYHSETSSRLASHGGRFLDTLTPSASTPRPSPTLGDGNASGGRHENNRNDSEVEGGEDNPYSILPMIPSW
ncbi:hypothetical protein IV203_008801 [Nitzschia inconspicua]|uniref:Uncharacterized protein n=1 Tax=Nitzschia inconspicua TaxID=303405 RepID=A0A9K3PMG6_9STRA|nr:hypothetical protein IV203_008801 [Nitzschia inconspicua]